MGETIRIALSHQIHHRWGSLDDMCRPQRYPLLSASEHSAARVSCQAQTGGGASRRRGSPVTLDGSDNYDRNGDLSTFHGSLLQAPSGSATTLDELSTPQPRLTPDTPGTYVVELVVHDELAERSAIAVSIMAVVGNAPPNARAGQSRNTLVGAAVGLDGRGSHDPEQAPLSFVWCLTSTPAGSALTDANIVQRESPTPQ